MAADQKAGNEWHYCCASIDRCVVVHVGFHDSYCWQNDVLPVFAVSILVMFDMNGEENCLFF